MTTDEFNTGDSTFAKPLGREAKIPNLVPANITLQNVSKTDFKNKMEEAGLPDPEPTPQDILLGQIFKDSVWPDVYIGDYAYNVTIGKNLQGGKAVTIGGSICQGLIELRSQGPMTIGSPAPYNDTIQHKLIYKAKEASFEKIIDKANEGTAIPQPQLIVSGGTVASFIPQIKTAIERGDHVTVLNQTYASKYTVFNVTDTALTVVTGGVITDIGPQTVAVNGWNILIGQIYTTATVSPKVITTGGTIATILPEMIEAVQRGDSVVIMLAGGSSNASYNYVNMSPTSVTVYSGGVLTNVAENTLSPTGWYVSIGQLYA